MQRARLVPELYVSDIERSRALYVDVLGFRVVYERVEERFVYLEREGAEIMLEQPVGRAWVTGAMEHPYGRGVNFEIDVSDVDALYRDVQASGAAVFLPMEETWYRRGDVLVGNRQLIVQDPDGYLLRFAEDLGERPV